MAYVVVIPGGNDTGWSFQQGLQMCTMLGNATMYEPRPGATTASFVTQLLNDSSAFSAYMAVGDFVTKDKFETYLGGLYTGDLQGFNWGLGEPTISGCVTLDKEGNSHVVPCSSQQAIICERLAIDEDDLCPNLSRVNDLQLRRLRHGGLMILIVAIVGFISLLALALVISYRVRSQRLAAAIRNRYATDREALGTRSFMYRSPVGLLISPAAMPPAGLLPGRRVSGNNEMELGASEVLDDREGGSGHDLTPDGSLAAVPAGSNDEDNQSASTHDASLSGFPLALSAMLHGGSQTTLVSANSHHTASSALPATARVNPFSGVEVDGTDTTAGEPGADALQYDDPLAYTSASERSAPSPQYDGTPQLRRRSSSVAPYDWD